MYAVIATGGKQEKVSEGQRIEVELLGAEEGSEVSFIPVLVVDGDSVLATPDQLAGASVSPRSRPAERAHHVEDQRWRLHPQRP